MRRHVRLHPRRSTNLAALRRLARGAGLLLVAVFCWGFALYGHGVYLTELHRLHGWPTASISVGVTGFYLLVAALVVFISDAITRFGPKRVMLAGACCFGAGVALLPFINALWQLYPVYLLMASAPRPCTSARSATWSGCGSIASAGSR